MDISPIIIGKLVRDRSTQQVGRIVDILYNAVTKLNVAVYFPEEKTDWDTKHESSEGAVWYVEKQTPAEPARTIAILQEAPEEEAEDAKKTEIEKKQQYSVREMRHIIRCLHIKE